MLAVVLAILTNISKILIFCVSLSSLIFIISDTNYLHLLQFAITLSHYNTSCITPFPFIYYFHYLCANYQYLLLSSLLFHLIITHLVNKFYNNYVTNICPKQLLWDSRTNTNSIIDYIISSPAIFNKIQNLALNNDLSSDYSAILFDFPTNINKSTLPPIKIKLYYKGDWDFINSSLSKQLAILQDQILNLISFDNSDLINIINNAATIHTHSIMNIHNNLPEKSIKPNTSVPFSIQLLIKQKRKVTRAFIKTRNPFPKSALNAVSKKLKTLIKSHRATDI